MKERDQILGSISRIAAILLGSTLHEGSIQEVLSVFGEITNASRAFFITLEGYSYQDLPSANYQWVKSGLSYLPNELFEWKRKRAVREDFDRPFQACLAEFDSEDRILLEGHHILSLLQVPVFIQGVCKGILGVEDCEQERVWSDSQIEITQAISLMVGAALGRRRETGLIRDLYESEREKHQIAQVLQEVGSSLNSTLDFESLLDQILEQIPRLLPYDTAVILLVEGKNAYVVRERGYSERIQTNPYVSKQKGFDWTTLQNLCKIVETQRPVVVPDVTVFPDWVWFEGAEHIRSWIGAPVVAQQQVIAFVMLDKMEPMFYRHEHADVLMSFANQVALAMQNARLYAETLEAFKREQRLNEMTRMISSELDLSQVLSRVVRLAVELVGASSGFLDVRLGEESKREFSYAASYPEEMGDLIKKDARFRRLFRKQSPTMTIIEDASGRKEMLCVPLIAGNQNFGILCLLAFSDVSFGVREMKLAESVGWQAGVAIQNADRLWNARRRAIESDLLRQSASMLTSALDMDEVLDMVLTNMSQVVPYDSAAIFLIEKNGYKIVSEKGNPGKTKLIGMTFPIDNRLFGDIRSTGRPIFLKNALKDPRFEGWGGNHVRGWLGVPLWVRGEIIGMIGMDSRKVGAYDSASAVLAQTFANDAAIALENARLFKQVQLLAITDPLTGLYNRRYFYEAAYRELRRALRYKTPLSLFVLDIDFFKRINDRFGHLSGDRLLRELAASFKSSMRDADILARYGGEEFVGLLPQTPLHDAYQVADRIRMQASEVSIDVDGIQVQVTVSVGVAAISEDCQDIAQLFQRADRALFMTKEAGRDKVMVWDQSIG